MTDRSNAFRAAITAPNPKILVVHPDPTCSDLLQAVTDAVRSTQLTFSAVHRSSVAAALANPEPNVVAAFVSVAGAEQPPLEQLREVYGSLLNLVLVEDKAAPRGAPRKSRLGEVYPSVTAPGEGGATFGGFVVECTPLVVVLRFLIESLRDVMTQFHFIATAPNLDEQRAAARLLLSQMARLLNSDLRIIEEINESGSEWTASVSHDTAFLDFIAEAAMADHLRVQAKAQSADEIALGDLLSKKRLQLLEAGTGQALSVTPFKGIFHERRPFWVGLAYTLEGSVVSALGVVPHLENGPLVEARLAVLDEFFQVWAQNFERVFLAELAKRTAASNAAGRQAGEHTIHQMVCGLAHELNTPLGVITTAAALIEGMLKNGHMPQGMVGAPGQDVVADLKEASGMITNNAKRLGELVERVKSISSLQVTDQPESTLITQMIDDAIVVHKTEVKGKPGQVQTLYDLDPGCESWIGYPRVLKQIVVYLLQNSYQHGYKGGSGLVEISLRGRMVNGAPNYSMRLTDYGAGISRTDLPKIFDPFFTTTRNVTGAGLGLAIVDNLVKQVLGGEIRCESDQGKGTSFFLDFASTAVTKQ